MFVIDAQRIIMLGFVVPHHHADYNIPLPPSPPATI